MKTLYGYCGKIGSGKAYCMLQQVEKLKTNGNSVYLTSFADSLKSILRDSFGITKDGAIEHKIKQMSPMYIRCQIIDSIYKCINSIQNLPPALKSLTDIELKTLIADNYDKWPEFPNSVLKARFAANKEEYDHYFRIAAQLIGTELGRHILDSIWVDSTLARINSVFCLNLADYAFIDDVRFMNEYDIFQKEWAFQSEVIGVVADDNTRALRRNISIEELSLQNNHASEQGIDAIIEKLPTKNIIFNG